MTTPSAVAARIERPLSPPSPGRKGRLARATIGACLLLGLSGFNAWWYWRDARPLPALKTVSDWIGHERYLEAEPALREHLRRSPYDVEARMMLARALAGRGDFAACARELHQVPYWSPQKAEALYREGQSYIKVDRAKDAEAAWSDLIKDDPLHPVAAEIYHDGCQELLKLYAIEDRWEDAFPVMWAAFDHAAVVDRPVLLAMRMRPELERVSPKESIFTIERYVAADPTDGEALRALARAKASLGNPAEAARLYQDCLKRHPQDVRAWRDYLTMLLEQGDLDGFLAVLRQEPKSADAEPETWLFRGVASEKAGDMSAAAESYRKAIELHPYVPKYYYRLAMAEERLGLRDEAVAHRKRTKEMNDARAQLPVAYSKYFAAIGTDQQAPSPELPAVCKQLASICETLGWSRAAQAWSQLAVSPRAG